MKDLYNDKCSFIEDDLMKLSHLAWLKNIAKIEDESCYKCNVNSVADFLKE